MTNIETNGVLANGVLASGLLANGSLANRLDSFLERFFRRNENNEMHRVKSCSDVLGPSFLKKHIYVPFRYSIPEPEVMSHFAIRCTNSRELNAKSWLGRCVRSGDYVLSAR